MPNERHYSNELNLESVGINLPYNMQAEQSVLGAVLLKPETLTDLVEILRPEMFYTRQNAQIYSEMLRLFTSDQTIDFVTLLDAVISDGVFPSADEAKVYLTGLAETVPSISNVKASPRSCRKNIWSASSWVWRKISCRMRATSRTRTCCWKTPSSAFMRSAPGGIPAP